MDAARPRGNTKFTHHKTDTDALTAGETPSAGNYAAFARGCRDGAGGLPRVRISRRICAPAFHRPDRGPARRRGARPDRLRLPRRLRHHRRRQHRRPPRRRPRSASSRRCPATCRPSGKGIQHSVELAVKQANDTNADPRLEARGLLGRRRGQGRRRQERRHQARRRTTRSSASSATSTPASASRPSRSSRRPTSPRSRPANTNPSLTIGADAGDPEAGVQDVLPYLHHGRGPGPVRRAVPLGAGHQERRDDPRQEGLRPGPRRRVHHGVQEGRRHRRRGRDDQPRRVELPGRRVQGRPVEAAGRLLRR